MAEWDEVEQLASMQSRVSRSTRPPFGVTEALLDDTFAFGAEVNGVTLDLESSSVRAARAAARARTGPGSSAR